MFPAAFPSVLLPAPILRLVLAAGAAIATGPGVAFLQDAPQDAAQEAPPAVAPQNPTPGPGAGAPEAPDEEPQILALEGATVHTMIPGETARVASVIVVGDRIRSVGLGTEIPEGAIRVDLAGKHLIPGLIDGMVNHDPDHDRLYVSAGVTLVRDVGNDLARILSERDAEHRTGARDRGPGPAILCAGAILDGNPPATTAAIVLGTPEEAAEKLPRFFELEPDFLSFHSGLPPAVWSKVIELGHARGLQVWGPRLPGLDLARVVQAGQDGLFHLEAFVPAKKSWPELTDEDVLGTMRGLTGKPIAFTPTLAIFAKRLLFPKDRPAELDYLGPMYVTSWLADAAVRQEVQQKNPEYLRQGLAVVGMQGRITKALFDRGITLVPGSASPNPWLLPGEALVDELSMWTRAGIPARGALEAATSRAARALGVAADRGTIEGGKIADLVVLAGDPTQDIAALHAPETVVLRGHVLPREFLDALRKDLADRQRTLQAASFQPLSVAEPKLPEGEVLLRGTAETTARGQRTSGESWAIVRLEDGALAYCTHLRTLGSVSLPDTDLELRQTIRDGLVVGFDVEIRTGTRQVSVKGTQAAGVLTVERHVDQAFHGNVPVRDALAFVDVGSALTAMALGQQTRVGKLKVLFFDDLDPAVGNWELRVDREGTHLARTHDGALTAKLGSDGSLVSMQRQRGNGVATTTSLSSQATGAGIPVREKKAE